MINKDFYPTPESVANTMLSKIDVTNKVVLEPSAGKGDLANVIKIAGAKEVVVCEVEPTLQKTLTDYRFLKADFLSVASSDISHIDFIVMNPPFSKGSEHILHAYDIAPEGCEIVALMNYDTTHGNRFSKISRQLNSLIGQQGYSEYLGEVFVNAERKTNVPIDLIYLHKPKTSSENEFEGFFDMSEEYTQNISGLIPYNEVQNIVSRYVGAVKMFEEVMQSASKINNLTSDFKYNPITFGAYKTTGIAFGKITRNEYKKELQKSAWRTVFEKLNMQKYLTSSAMELMNKFVEQQEKVPFTVKNIFKILEMIYATKEERFQKALIEVFDWLTMHHHDNRHNVEGWKTNEQYMVGKKFIAPYIGIRMNWDGKPELGYTSDHRFDDFTKALCGLTGKDFEEIGTIYQLFQSKQIEQANSTNNYRPVYEYKEWGKWFDYGFFEIKVFKKGTLHAKFKDEKVWEQFNLAVAKAKGWELAETYQSKNRNKSINVKVKTK